MPRKRRALGRPDAPSVAPTPRATASGHAPRAASMPAPRRGVQSPPAHPGQNDGDAPWPLVAAIAVVLLGGVYGLHRLVDPDLFQQVAVGRQLLAHPGSIGVSNFIRSYPDYPYVEDKWLACVVASLFDRLGGADGLMLYQIALCIAVAGAWFVMLRRWRASHATAVLGVALALVACAFRLEPRPDTASHGLLALTMALVPLARPPRHVLAMTVALFVLWINVHGYFVNGLLVLLAAAVATAFGDRDLVARGLPSPAQRFALLAAAVAACLVHPQGWRALASPVEQLAMMRNAGFRAGIQELEPIGRLFTGAGVPQWIVLGGPFLAALASALAGAAAARRQAAAFVAALPWLVWPPAGMADALPYRLTMALWVMAAVELAPALRARRFFAPLVLAGFTILTLPAVRNLPLVVPASLLVLAPVWTQLEAALPARGRWLAATALVAVLVTAGWLRLSDRLNGDVRVPTRTGWGIDGDRFPVAATDFVLRAGLADGLLNGFDDGGYLLYRLYPERRVFIAGNTSMYPIEFFETYRAQVTGPELDLDALVARYGFDTVIWNLASSATKRIFAAFAADPRWKLAFLDHGGAVFTRVPAIPALDLQATVPVLAARAVYRPALPTWLGGKVLEYPALDLPAFLYKIGRFDLALVAAEPLWPALGTERLAALIGSAASRTGTLGAHLPELESALARWPASEDLRSVVFLGHAAEANRLLGAGGLTEAGRHLDRMRTIRPRACGPYTGLAKIAALNGDAAEARRMIAEALARDTDQSCRRGVLGDPQLAALFPSQR